MTTDRKQTFVRRRRPSDRRGFMLASALIVFCIVVVTLFAVLQGLVSQQRQLRASEHAVQADYLAEAGLARAKVQLGKSSLYRGETWRLSATELDGLDAGVVSIEVKQQPNTEKTFTIQTQADFPSDSTYRARKSREAEFTLP
jgi:Tfp pilus assembly protein PilX